MLSVLPLIFLKQTQNSDEMQHTSSYSNLTEDMKKAWKTRLHLTQSPSQNPVTGKKPHMKQHFSEGETEPSYVQAEKPQREVVFTHEDLDLVLKNPPRSQNQGGDQQLQ